MSALLPLLVLSASTLQSPSAGHPAGAVAYVELPDLAAVRETWPSTSLGRMIADETVRGLANDLMEAQGLSLETAWNEQVPEPVRRLGEALGQQLVRASLSIHTTADQVEETFDGVKEIQATQNRLAELRGRLATYRRENGAFPPRLVNLDPLFEEEFVDAWSNPFVYQVSADGNNFSLKSLGADGAEGGSGAGRDILHNVFNDVPPEMVLDDFGALLLLEFSDADTASGLLSLIMSEMPEGAANLELAEDEPAGFAFQSEGFAQRVSITVAEATFRIRIGDPERLPFANDKPVTGEFEQNNALLPEQAGVPVMRGYSNLPQGLQYALEAGLPLDLKDLGYIGDTLEAFFGPMVSSLLRGGAWSMHLHEGRWITDGFVPSDSPLPSLFGYGPVGDVRLERLHPDAVLAWVTRMHPNWIEDIFNQLFGSAKDAYMDQIQAAHGIRLDQELQESLGNEVAMSVPPLRSLLALPAVFGEVDVLDAERVRTALEALSALWVEKSGGTCKESEYRKVPIFTFETKKGDAPASPIPGFNMKPVVSLVLFEDHLLLTTSLSMAKREVRRRLTLDADSPRPALFEGVEVPPDAVELVVANWTLFLGRLYDTVRGLGPMISQMMEVELPIDLATLPESNLFTNFFEPTVRYEIQEEAGRRFREVASLGPELTGLLIVAANVGLVSRSQPFELTPLEEGR